jgi:ATP-dependent DNA helicase Q1
MYLYCHNHECFYLQLEKLIGKVKTEKYGAQIIQVIQQYATSDDDLEELNLNEEVKPRKKGKAVVVVESSEDEK